MKILKQTITQLTLQTKSIFSSLRISIFLMAGGLIWLTLTYNSTTLSCQRLDAKKGSCELTRSGLLGSNTEEISLRDLQGAKVESDEDSSRMLLLTNRGEVPFTYYYLGGFWDKYRLASEVNSFVKNTEHRSLKLTQDDRWFGMIGGIVLLIGLALIVFSENKTYNFDKTFAKMTVKQFGLMVNKVTEHSVHKISGVELEKTKDSDGNTSYQVKLLMLGGDRLCLSTGSDRGEQQKIAGLIRSYLNGRST